MSTTVNCANLLTPLFVSSVLEITKYHKELMPVKNLFARENFSLMVLPVHAEEVSLLMTLLVLPVLTTVYPVAQSQTVL